MKRPILYESVTFGTSSANTTCCQQVCNKLLTICNNLIGIIRHVARLFRQVSYSHDITILLQPGVASTLDQGCYRLVGTTFATNLIMPSTLLQIVNSPVELHSRPNVSTVQSGVFIRGDLKIGNGGKYIPNTV